MNRDTIPTAHEGLAGLSLMSLDEIDKLISVLPLRGHMLEIGTASGVTAALLAKARPELRIISIDPYPDLFDPSLDPGDNRLQNWRNNRQHHTQNLWVGTLKELAIFVQGQIFDAILIDGDHFHQGIYGDLLYSDKLLKPHGLLISHDYEMEDWQDVTRAIKRFMTESPFQIIDRCGNLAIMRRAE